MFQQGFNHPDKSARRFFCRGAVGGNGRSDMVQVRFMNQAEQTYFPGMFLAMAAAQEMIDISILLRVEIKAVIPVFSR